MSTAANSVWMMSTTTGAASFPTPAPLTVANITANMSASASGPKFSIEAMIDKTLLKIEVLTMSLVFTLALFGNAIVILTLVVKEQLKRKSKQASANKFKRMNFFIFHLCLADIYVSLGNILTMLLWRMNYNIFYGNDLACRLVAYFQLVSVYYSTYVLMAMTYDRYEAICKPMVGLSWSPRRGLAYIALAFGVSHLQGVPQVVFFALRVIPNSEPPIKTCYAVFTPPWFEKAYIVYTWFMQFLLPLCMIIGCYASISIQVLRSLKGKNITQTNNRRRSIQVGKNEWERLAENSKISGGADELKENSHYNNTNRRRSSALLVNKINGKKEAKSLLKNVDKLSGSNHSLVVSQRARPSPGGISGSGDAIELRQHCAKNFSKSKIKTIKLTLTVIILYVICSTPYFIGMIMLVMMSSIYSFNSIRYLIVISCLLFQLNSCVNPWIYLSFNAKRKPNKKEETSTLSMRTMSTHHLPR